MFNPAKVLESFFSPGASEAVERKLSSALPFGINPTEAEKRATVDQPIQPGAQGRVKFQGSWWPARCERDMRLMQGEVVRVVGIRNITLLVEPVSLSLCQ